MSDLKKEYKSQIDDFCNNVNTLPADDILAISNPGVRRTRPLARVAVAAMICIVVGIGGTVGAGAAGIGPFVSWFTKTNDPITAELASEGYLLEVNETKSCGIIEASFMGVAGDTRFPTILMKIHVDDEEIVSENDKIQVCIYAGIEKNNYETARYDLFDPEYLETHSYYGFETVWAVRDEENPSDYVLSVKGYMVENIPAVVAVRSIRYDVSPSEEEYEEIMTDIRFDITLKESVVKQSYRYYLENPVYYTNSAGIEYEVIGLEFSAYTTELLIHIDDSKLLHDQSMDAELQSQWTELEKDIYILADGVKYKSNCDGYFVCEHMYETGLINKAVINSTLEIVPFETAQSMQLYFGDELIMTIPAK